MKSEYKIALCIIFASLIIFGGIFGGFIASLIIFEGILGGSFTPVFLDMNEVFWIGFGIGSFLGLAAFLILLHILEIIDLNYLNPLYWCIPKSKPKDSFWAQGNVYEKVESVEEKDDYKNLEWLRRQYYESGKTIQDIANNQGVSMITIRKWIDKLKAK